MWKLIYFLVGGIGGFFLGWPICMAIANARHWSQHEGGGGIALIAIFYVMPACGIVGAILGGIVGALIDR